MKTNQHEAQQRADGIGHLRQELGKPELQQVLALTPEQQSRFEEWAGTQLALLAQQFDVDTSSSQKRVSWGMRIAATLGAIAICAAVVLFFMRYWGYFDTPVQVGMVAVVPLMALAGAEFAASRERTLYFTGLLALVAFASFVMNLVVLGNIFNINSTERSMLAWGTFALLLAYRYGLRFLLAMGLLLMMAYGAATVSAQLGYLWFDFGQRPELIALLALVTFCVPFVMHHQRRSNFPPVYRLVGEIVFFVAVFSLTEWGVPSYLPLRQHNVEGLYGLIGLLMAAGTIWLGIRRRWEGLVNISAIAFVVFLFSRLYHWWWDWLPRYLFFALIGALGIALVLAFKRLRERQVERKEGLA